MNTKIHIYHDTIDTKITLEDLDKLRSILQQWANTHSLEHTGKNGNILISSGLIETYSISPEYFTPYLLDKFQLNNQGTWEVWHKNRWNTLPKDLCKYLHKKRLVPRDSKVVLELLSQGYVYVYLQDDPKSGRIIASSLPPVKLWNGYYVDLAAKNKVVTGRINNPRKLYWNESLAKLEDLL